MKQRILIEYDPIEQTIRIAENDFTNLEAFGVLEGAKAMISDYWIRTSEGENESDI